MKTGRQWMGREGWLIPPGDAVSRPTAGVLASAAAGPGLGSISLVNVAVATVGDCIKLRVGGGVQTVGGGCHDELGGGGLGEELDVCTTSKGLQWLSGSERNTVGTNVGVQPHEEHVKEQEVGGVGLAWRDEGEHPVQQLGRTDISGGGRQSCQKLRPLKVRELIHIQELVLEDLVGVIPGRGLEEGGDPVSSLLRERLDHVKILGQAGCHTLGGKLCLSLGEPNCNPAGPELGQLDGDGWSSAPAAGWKSTLRFLWINNFRCMP